MIRRRLGAMFGYLRGNTGPDRMVPRASLPLRPVGFLAALLAFFAALALAAALAGGRLAATWQGALAETATLQVFAPEAEIEESFVKARPLLDAIASGGKQQVSPVGPIPSSAAGFAVGVRDSLQSGLRGAAPAMSVAAARTPSDPRR